MVRDKAANSGSNKIIKDQVTIKKVCLSSREQWEPLKSSKQGNNRSDIQDLGQGDQ